MDFTENDFYSSYTSGKGGVSSVNDAFTIHISKAGEDMYKKIIYVLICLIMMLPTLLSAAALDRYSVPQQEPGYTPPPRTTESPPGDVSEDVYIKFERKVSKYSPAQKEKLKEDYSEKKANALRERNFDAATYYQRLIDILNSN